MEQYYKKITSSHKWYELKLGEVYQYRDLIGLFVKRNFVVRYKQTLLGPVWLFLTPIISSIIYCFIFGGIAGISTDGVPQILFYLTGSAAWTLFSSALLRNATSFIDNASVFGKVYFPRITVPISNMITSMIELCIQMLMIVVFLVIYVVIGEVAPNWLLFVTLPVVILLIGLLGLGCGIVISSLTTKYRDLTIVVGFLVQLWMYVTPVVYPMSEITVNWMKVLVYINPVTSYMELLKYVVLGVGEVSFLPLTWSIVFTVTVCLVGLLLFNKVEKTFMDTV